VNSRVKHQVRARWNPEERQIAGGWGGGGGNTHAVAHPLHTVCQTRPCTTTTRVYTVVRFPSCETFNLPLHLPINNKVKHSTGETRRTTNYKVHACLALVGLDKTCARCKNVVVDDGGGNKTKEYALVDTLTPPTIV